MLLFSFALAHHFQTEQEQKTEIQRDLLKSKEEALIASRLSEERLEVAVNTRTEKLQHLLLSEQHIREQYVRFGAMIAHEFRNPLNIIGAQTTLLELDLSTSSEKVFARTSVIHGAVTRLTRLFDQWLESDRLSHANNQIDVQAIEVSPWLTNLIDLYREYYSSHQIVIDRLLHPVKILGDDHLLQIAILNLIENACKYSPINTTIEIGLKLDDYAVGIYVKDNGCGIPLQMQEKILEPYIRMESNKDSQGVGLGLAFVKRIMEAHDGRIEIQSQENIGSDITLWFPESAT
jgi:signal transduction histidine kinase